MPTFHLQTNGRRRCGHAACPKPAGRHSHPSLNWGFAPPPLPAVPGDRVSSSQIIAGTSGRRGRPGRHLFACLLPPPPPAAVTAPWRCLLSVSLPAPRLPPPADLSKAVAQETGKPEAVSCTLPGSTAIPPYANAIPTQPPMHGAALLTRLYPHAPLSPACPPARPPACLQYVMVSLQTDKQMMFGGTEEKCAYGELVSIGAIGGDKNKKASRGGGQAGRPAGRAH